MSDGGQGGPVAGWYPDPTDANLRRYWDGDAWTDHTAPLHGVGGGVPGGAASPADRGAGAPDGSSQRQPTGPSGPGGWQGDQGSWPGGQGSWQGGQGSWQGGQGSWQGGQGSWQGGQGSWQGGQGSWQGAGGSPQQVDTWLWQSIVATLVCCLPLGVVGIVFAAQAQSAINVGNYAEAEQKARTARIFTLSAVGAFVLLIVLWFALVASFGMFAV